MRNLLITLAAALGLVTLAGPAAAQGALKIGYIDSNKILAEAPGAQAAREAFEKDMARYRSELQGMEAEIQKAVTEYEQQQVMLSPDAKKQREGAIIQKQEAYRQRVGQLEKQAAERQAELVQPVMDQIRGIIDEVRKTGGYAIIFNVASDGIVAADPALDITNEVLSRLKTTAANAPAKQP
jgi:outer membrane protein